MRVMKCNIVNIQLQNKVQELLTAKTQLGLTNMNETSHNWALQS